MDRQHELQQLSTFDLAFNIATGMYSEQEKFLALGIIKDRDRNTADFREMGRSDVPVKRAKSNKKPLKGSKAEKIFQLYEGGLKTAAEIQAALKKKKIVAYYPEIYRVLRLYTDFD